VSLWVVIEEILLVLSSPIFFRKREGREKEKGNLYIIFPPIMALQETNDFGENVYYFHFCICLEMCNLALAEFQAAFPLI